MNKIESELQGKSGIYLFTNLVNGKRYVGSSLDIYTRLHDHKSLLKNNKAHNSHFQNAWNKYGEDSFIFGILEYCDEKIRFDREQYYIDTLKPEYNNSLNVEPNFGIPCSEETKRKISNTLKLKYSTGEISAYRQDHNWIKTWIYNINDFTLVGVFDCRNDALKYIQCKKTSDPLNTIFKKKYILSNKEYKYKYELQNFVNEKFLKANSVHGTYIIGEDLEGNMTYYLDFKKCAEGIGSARGTLIKHYDSRKENPYVVRKTGYKFYMSYEFIPIKPSAVLVEESQELLQTENGEVCDDNPVLSLETKESEPV